MRISFPNKERDDTLVGAGEVRIGAAADNDIVVAGDGVAAHHLCLKLGERGIELAVLDGLARTHVNTRPVREKAILRLGDMVSLGGLQFVLLPDRDADIRSDIPSESAASLPAAPKMPPGVLLRGLSGTYFGKIVPVRGRLVVGGQGDLALDAPGMAARHAAIEFANEAIALRSLDGGGTCVDGIEVRDAVLHAGDQLCFGRDRFLVEAPGLPQRRVSGVMPAWRSADPTITQTMQAVSLPEGSAHAAGADEAKDESAAGRNDIWWLIVAAAAIAAVLASLFLGVF